MYPCYGHEGLDVDGTIRVWVEEADEKAAEEQEWYDEQLSDFIETLKRDGVGPILDGLSERQKCFFCDKKVGKHPAGGSELESMVHIVFQHSRNQKYKHSAAVAADGQTKSSSIDSCLGRVLVNETVSRCSLRPVLVLIFSRFVLSSV